MVTLFCLVVTILTQVTCSKVVYRETRLGTVSGNLVTAPTVQYEEYLGIPYAEPPLGYLRFLPPVPLNTLKDKENKRYHTAPPACPQVMPGSVKGEVVVVGVMG